MKGTKEDVKRQKHSQTSDEGCVPSSQESHPSSSSYWFCPSCQKWVGGDMSEHFTVFHFPSCLILGKPNHKVGVE